MLFIYLPSHVVNKFHIKITFKHILPTYLGTKDIKFSSESIKIEIKLKRTFSCYRRVIKCTIHPSHFIKERNRYRVFLLAFHTHSIIIKITTALFDAQKPSRSVDDFGGTLGLRILFGHTSQIHQHATFHQNKILFTT